MKKFTLLTLLAFQFFQIAGNKLFNANNCYSQWVWMGNGLRNKYVQCIAGNGNNLFAGVIDSGVYYSSNGGYNWSKTSLNNKTVYSLAIKDNSILAGSVGAIYLSVDNGQTWSQTLNHYGLSLLVYGNKIFAGTSFWGVYLSTNNGQNWQQIGLNNRTIISLAVNNNIIFAGSDDYGVYVSTNNGQNWNQTPLNNIDVPSLAICGTNVFAGTQYNGVYRSENNGQSWVLTALQGKTVSCLMVSENNIFAGTHLTQGVFLSTNNGNSWIQKNQGFNYVPGIIYSLVLINNYVYAGVSYDVYRRSYQEIIGIQKISTKIPTSFSLGQNYPNPFNATTNIKFSLPKAENVRLIVLDLLGREVATLVNERLQAGTYSVDFDASNLTSGVYFYRIITGEFSDIKKMILVK